MTIQRFDVELENSTNIYQNGSVIGGKIYLDLDEPKKARGIKLTVLGQGRIQWKATKVAVKMKDVYPAEFLMETYVDEHMYLIGSKTGDVVIPAGKHVYPFSYKLAENIPASFKTEFGKITYKVRVSIERVWYLWNHQESINFHVNVPLDLNLHQKASEPVREEICKHFMGCDKPVNLVVTLPVRGYIPGEAIPITMELRNEAEVNLKGVYITLIKLNTYHAKRKSRPDEKVVCTHEIPLENEKCLEKRIQHFLQVPSLPPSYLRHAKLIDIDYFIRIEIRVGGLHKNVELDVPIIIGTLPLLASTVSKAIDEN